MNNETLIAILVAALGISETLGSIGSLKDNSIFQVVVRVLKSIYTMVTGKTFGQPQA